MLQEVNLAVSRKGVTLSQFILSLSYHSNCTRGTRCCLTTIYFATAVLMYVYTLFQLEAVMYDYNSISTRISSFGLILGRVSTETCLGQSVMHCLRLNESEENGHKINNIHEKQTAVCMVLLLHQILLDYMW